MPSAAAREDSEQASIFACAVIRISSLLLYENYS